jgi:hypothetical protein
LTPHGLASDDPGMIRVALGTLLMGFLFVVSTAAGQDRFVAEFTDGSRHSAMELHEWHSPDAQPQLGSRPLFDPGNPVRWLVDQTAAVDVRPEMFIEFHGGDRLAGEVQGYRPGSGSPYEQLPPHLIVRTESEWQPPEDRQAATIRVLTESVRRVVFEARPRDDWQPGHVFLRNGGQLAFHSLRWTVDGVSILLDDGVRAVEWAELAEIHLPRRDVERDYVEQIAALTPSLSGRLVQLDIADGSVLTTSTERFQGRHWGDKNRTAAWLHLIQPAWSLDPLWVRVPNIMTWRWWLPHEPPLTRFVPTNVDRDIVFSAGWVWQRDRNTLRQRLQVGERLFATGFGVHATTALTFDLPSLAREFRTRVGLDSAAGTGGCVAAQVTQRDGSVLFQQGPIVGSRDVADSGWQPLARSTGSLQLTLRIDMLRDNRPEGAEALDIRDIANWLDPVVRLDRDTLAVAVSAATARFVPGLAGWTKSGHEPLGVRNHLDETDARDFRYRPVIAVPTSPLTFSRSVPVTAKDRWLSLVVSRFGDNTPKVAAEIKLHGASAGTFDVPVRQGPIDPEPLTVPLPAGTPSPVDIEVTLTAAGPGAALESRGIAATAERPGIRALYEDDAAALLAAGASGFRTTTEEPFAGRESLLLSVGKVVWPQLDGVEVPIVDLPKLGQYRFIVFAWRTADAPGMTLWLANEGRLGPEWRQGLATLRPANPRQRRLEDKGLRFGYAYDIGRHFPGEGAPLRLDNKPPTQWRVESRDLINDFGPMTVTGFGLECIEAGTAWFDSLYLCRTPQDVERVRKEFGVRR